MDDCLGSVYYGSVDLLFVVLGPVVPKLGISLQLHYVYLH
jgi:hypothetical protein